MSAWVLPTVVILVAALLALTLPLVILLYYSVRINFRRNNLLSKIHELQLEQEYLRLYHFQEWKKYHDDPAGNEKVLEEFEKYFNASFEGMHKTKNYWLPLLLTFLTTSIMGLVFYAWFGEEVAGRVPIAATPVLPLAIAGGLFYVYPIYILRYASLSLTPTCLYELVGKLWLAVVVGAVGASLFEAPLKPIAAVVLALVPMAGLDFLKKTVFEKRKAEGQAEPLTSDLVLLEILQYDEQLLSQLSYIGIRSLSELAFENPLKVFLETDLNMEASLYLVDRANLCLYVPDKAMREDLSRYGVRGAIDLMTMLYEYDRETQKGTIIRPADPLPEHLLAPLEELARVLKIQHVDSLRNLIDIMMSDPKLLYLLELWHQVINRIDRLESWFRPENGPEAAI